MIKIMGYSGYLPALPSQDQWILFKAPPIFFGRKNEDKGEEEEEEEKGG